MSATESRRKVQRTTIAAVVAVLGVVVIAMLWQYPGAELVMFHAVWIGLSLFALRSSSRRLHLWVLVGIVGGLAILVEVDDLRTRYEVADTLVELLLDLPAFVVLVVLAQRQHGLVAAERQAAAAEQQRNERQLAFFANASHALRTPITIARGHTEMARNATHDLDVKADLAVVLEELDRLTTAADRNLRLSIAGEVDFQRLRPVDVHELVRTTVERWAPTAPRAWSAETRGEVAELLADPDQLTEALDAMIENSLLATDVGGSIVVRSEVTADSVELSVIDDGCGVEVIDPRHLFEPFERGPRRSTDDSGGTGLGLALVRAIAKAHHGNAEMETAPGAGATVRMRLPLRDPGIPQRASDRESPATSA